MFGERSGLVPQARGRPDLIAINPPPGELGLGFCQRCKERLVEAFVPQLVVEAFVEGILLRLARGDVMSFDLAILIPICREFSDQIGAAFR